MKPYALKYFKGGDFSKRAHMAFLDDAPKLRKYRLDPAIMALELRSPEPVAFDYHWRGAKGVKKPSEHVTLYFPDPELLDFEDAIKLASGRKQEKHIRDLGKKAAAYNFRHNDGPENPEPEEMKFVLTNDYVVHAFADNCVLLVPINDPVDGRNERRSENGNLWLEITPTVLALGEAGFYRLDI